MNEATIANINLAVLGAKSCGKSALTVRYFTRRFIGEYDSEKDTCISRIVHINGKELGLHVTDTAESDWITSPQTLIGWSTAIIIVYSVTDKWSFKFARYLLKRLNISKRLDAGCVMLLGNKVDLKQFRIITCNRAKKLASHYGILHDETSAACDSTGVKKVFDKLLCQTLSSQISKMLVLKISLEKLEQFETTCRSLRTRRRSSSDSLRLTPNSGSSDEDELTRTTNNMTMQENKRIQNTSLVQKFGKINL